MRIVISNPRRSWGGASTMAAGLARGLRGRGHEVVVFCRPGSPLHRELRGELPCEPILEGMDFSPRAVWRCVRALRRHRTQVVVSATSKDLRLTAPAARLLGVPLIVRMVAAVPFRDRLQDRFFYGWMPEHFVANSAATREVMLASAPWLADADITMIHNGIEVETYASAVPAELGLPPGAVAIGFVGRLAAEKGLPDLAAAWKRVAEAVPGAHLLIAGTGEREAELRQRLAGAPRVHWLGFRRDIPSIMRVLDLLVLPSHSEAFGLAAAEAMAAGTPVVATRVGGLTELLADDEGGCLVPPHAPEALARAIIGLAADPGLRRRIGQAGQQRVRRCFSHERAVEGYEALLNRVVNRAEATRRGKAEW